VVQPPALNRVNENLRVPIHDNGIAMNGVFALKSEPASSSYKNCHIRSEYEDCHFDRSEAEWRNLLFFATDASEHPPPSKDRAILSKAKDPTELRQAPPPSTH
jgi:hypothetical protein